jgi:AraC-like DNA-binding protein/quercetin dioxygenase-like cupin family protein
MVDSIKNMLPFITKEPGWKERQIPVHSEHLAPLRERDVLRGGLSEIRRPAVIHRPRHNFHWVVYSLRGAARVEREGRQLRLKKGQLWLVPAGSEYTCRPEEGGWEYMWFHLADSSMWAHLHDLDSRSIAPGLPTRTLLVMEAILGETTIYQLRDSPQMLRASAEIVAIWIVRRLKAQADPRLERIRLELTALWRKVGERPARSWRAPGLAEALGVSVPQLHRYTAAIHNQSPMGMVRRIRMSQAEELLLGTDHPLKHIAAAVGYETPFSFSKAFRRYAGCSPREFRRRRRRGG